MRIIFFPPRDFAIKRKAYGQAKKLGSFPRDSIFPRDIELSKRWRFNKAPTLLGKKSKIKTITPSFPVNFFVVFRTFLEKLADHRVRTPYNVRG